MSKDELEQAKSEYTDKLKRVKLLEAGVDYTDVNVFVKYLKSDDPEEIEEEAQAIVADIEQHNTATDVNHNKTTWKPFG